MIATPLDLTAKTSVASPAIAPDLQVGDAEFPSLLEAVRSNSPGQLSGQTRLLASTAPAESPGVPVADKAHGEVFVASPFAHETAKSGMDLPEGGKTLPIKGLGVSDPAIEVWVEPALAEPKTAPADQPLPEADNDLLRWTFPADKAPIAPKANADTSPIVAEPALRAVQNPRALPEGEVIVPASHRHTSQVPVGDDVPSATRSANAPLAPQPPAPLVGEFSLVREATSPREMTSNPALPPRGETSIIAAKPQTSAAQIVEQGTALPASAARSTGSERHADADVQHRPNMSDQQQPSIIEPRRDLGDTPKTSPAPASAPALHREAHRVAAPANNPAAAPPAQPAPVDAILNPVPAALLREAAAKTEAQRTAPIAEGRAIGAEPASALPAPNRAEAISGPASARPPAGSANGTDLPAALAQSQGPGPAAPVAAQAAPTIAAPAAPAVTHTAELGARTDGGAQLESAISQLAEARETGRKSRPELTVRHQDFGAVRMRIEATGSDLRATIANRDPAFIPAVQAALAERALSQAGDSSSAGSQRGSENSGNSASGNNAQSEARYGSSTGSGQGSSQPYREQMVARDEDRPVQGSGGAANSGEQDPGGGDVFA